MDAVLIYKPNHQVINLKYITQFPKKYCSLTEVYFTITRKFLLRVFRKIKETNRSHYSQLTKLIKSE